MKATLFIFARLGMISLILSPLPAAQVSASPEDSVHFCAFDDYEQWRRDNPRPSAKRLAN